MKLIVTRPVEIEASFIRVSVAVRYEEEDIPNDFPLRRGELWEGTIAIDNGEIQGWPKGKSGEMYMKVCDCGNYALLNHCGEEIARIDEGYVPRCIPGEYGDYIDFKIDENGRVKGWATKCTAQAVRESFFRNEE